MKFLSRTSGYTLFLTQDEAVLMLRGTEAAKRFRHGVKPRPLEVSSSVVQAIPFPRIRPMAGAMTQRTNELTAPGMVRGVLRMKLRNANTAATVTGLDELAGKSNYFIGNDPAQWRTNVPTYAKVKYEGIYPGMDLVYYGNQRQLEYDFIVAPGADPRRIAFDVLGAKRIRQDVHGDLVVIRRQGR